MLDGIERSSRELSEHLQLALDAAGLGTFRWERATGRVEWDERMEELFGFAPGTFDGTFEAYRAALHPDDRDAALATVDRAMETGQPYRIEHRVLLPDGKVRWILGSGRPTTDDDGVITGAIGCSRDFTDVVEHRLEREAIVEQERLHRERLELLAGVNEALAHSNDRHEIMAGVVRAVVPHLADWCSIHVLPEATARVPDSETFHVDPAMVAFARQVAEDHPYDPEAAHGVPKVIRTGEPEFVPVIDESTLATLDAGQEARELVLRLGLRSVIGVPLIKRGRILGALQLLMTDSRRRYTEDDLAIAQAIAARVAASLENRRLSELHRHIATTLQQSLLPDHLPAIEGMDVAVRYWAAGEGTEVGGDFYDLFPVGDDSWAAVVGDVCGTGPTAAAMTSMARHSIRQSAWRGDDPASIFSWLNKAVREASGDGFLTAAYLNLHRDGGTFEVDLALAGHPLPVVVRADGKASYVGRPGTLVGVFDEVRIHPQPVTLAPGDTVVLYTDGASDVTPPYDLDERGLLDLLAECVTQADDAEAMADCIYEALAERLPMDRREDDIALLVLHVCPS